jgi:hypothetical protein
MAGTNASEFTAVATTTEGTADRLAVDAGHAPARLAEGRAEPVDPVLP